ncbi:MAG: class I SAM-dependent methyltransferase [bacterium]|nr:class I SAM-dependent methyltransferase [bacterium]
MDHIISRLTEAVTFSNLLAAQQDTEGFLQPAEGYALYLLASLGSGAGEIVEIGSYMGKSTFWLARGAMDMAREHVTAVDHFIGSPEHREEGQWHSDVLEEEGTTFHAFMKNITNTGVAQYVNPIRSSSREAVQNWTQPIRLLFIDGEHSYEAVKQDFDMWFPFVCPGGIVAFHDFDASPHVNRVVSEVLSDRQDVTEFFQILTLVCLQRALA